MVYVKRVSQILIFFLGLIIILRGLSVAFEPKDNTKEAGIEAVKANGILGEKENSIDVVIIGDSETYTSISPMEIWKEKGYTSYVCGSGAQPLDYTFKMLKRVYENQKPKIVILNTNLFFRKVDFTDMVKSIIGDDFSIFSYNDRWKSLNIKDVLKKPSYTWTDNNKGYVYNSKISAGAKKNYMIPTEKFEEIAIANRYIIEQIKNCCDENGSKLVLVSIPSAVNWNYARHNSVQKLSEDLECEYIDLNLLNDVIKIDWSKDTRDKGDHLNYFGAVKVTKFIAEYLEKSELLTDHREDENFQSWNKSLSIYLKKVKGK